MPTFTTFHVSRVTSSTAILHQHPPRSRRKWWWLCSRGGFILFELNIEWIAQHWIALVAQFWLLESNWIELNWGAYFLSTLILRQIRIFMVMPASAPTMPCLPQFNQVFGSDGFRPNLNCLSSTNFRKGKWWNEALLYLNSYPEYMPNYENFSERRVWVNEMRSWPSGHFTFMCFATFLVKMRINLQPQGSLSWVDRVGLTNGY